MRWIALLALCIATTLCLPAGLRGQGASPGAPQGRLDEVTAMALDKLAITMQQKAQQRDDALRQAQTERAKQLDGELEQLRWQFASLASRLDVQEFEKPQAGGFDLQQELEQLLRPLLRALKDATQGPRQIAELEARRDQVTERRRIAASAAQAIATTRDALPAGSPARAEAERELREVWDPRLSDLGREILVLNANLTQLRAAQEPLVTTVTSSVRHFVESSGLSLVLAVAVFLVVFFGLRFVADRLLRRRVQRNFPMRLFEVVLRVLTVLTAVAATLVVPYARNDWLLLAVCMVFLLGAGWVIVRMAPQFFEQIRLMLNIGAVREGERLLLDGLPFRVDALRFYSRLSNPALTGGVLRVPIKELLGLRSRAIGDGEPWFPCVTGDFVALADGTVGQVRLQTPEVVDVVVRHDAPRTYATAAFLGLVPRNLSQGFEIETTFGIDYRHQPQVLDEVPATFTAAVREELTAHGFGDHVQAMLVEFASAGASSLDFVVQVGFDGAAAVHYEDLGRTIQAGLVRACNRLGYGIPFPQLTVHRAEP